MLIVYRLTNLNMQFQQQMIKEYNWPGPVADPKSIYADFYYDLHSRANNITCACCSCIQHSLNDAEKVSATELYLTVLAVKLEYIKTEFSWRSGVPSLDSQNIMVDHGSIFLSATDTQEPYLTMCKPCQYQLSDKCLPPQALANHRWIGEVPEELKQLTWLKEKLLARRHLVGSIVRLEDRHEYMGLKGHMILVPQNTTELVHLLPRPISSRPDMIRVVWTGGNQPKYDKGI